MEFKKLTQGEVDNLYTDCRGSEFPSGHFFGTTFEGAECPGTDFSNSEMKQTEFIDTNLDRTNFDRTKLTDVDMARSDTSQAILDEAEILSEDHSQKTVAERCREAFNEMEAGYSVVTDWQLHLVMDYGLQSV